jgi:transcriptional regulator with XRE-family HTH domain
MGKRPADYKEANPHEDKLRMFRIGRWVTDCRLAKGWTMVDVAMRLHASFPVSHLGNQGRISELETGNGVNRARWTPEILHFLETIFQPCPPLPAEPWEHSDEYRAHLRKLEEAAEAKRRAELARREALLARRKGTSQLGMELMLFEDDLEPAAEAPA